MSETSSVQPVRHVQGMVRRVERHSVGSKPAGSVRSTCKDFASTSLTVSDQELVT